MVDPGDCVKAPRQLPKNILTVTRGEVGGDYGRKRGKGFQEHVQRTHGQNQRGIGSRVGSREKLWGKMETTVLEQQLNF